MILYCYRKRFNFSFEFFLLLNHIRLISGTISSLTLELSIQLFFFHFCFLFFLALLFVLMLLLASVIDISLLFFRFVLGFPTFSPPFQTFQGPFKACQFQLISPAHFLCFFLFSAIFYCFITRALWSWKVMNIRVLFAQTFRLNDFKHVK